ncbi:MAG: MBL fold metallo-hydrolase [Verrucomicrobiae bacterium]|nr:MBL fold metallo-hydrolase [Verrucomicrobiae bacterium]
MNLEDHLGDIIRKGRMIANVSRPAAAQAAGLTEAELSDLEESGNFSRRPNFAALGPIIKMEARKLEAIAAGWLPRPPQLKRWQHLRLLVSEGEGMTVNCYLVWDASTREAALFDTGFDAQPILQMVQNERLKLEHIFITHSHEDHVAALGEIRAASPGVQVHSHSRHAPATQRLQAGAQFALGALKISFRETPGHAADGVTYVVSGWPDHAPEVAVVGDTVFAGSMGRGNDGWELARNKIREEILSLPPATLLCPGHGPLTSVAEERANNPFF